LVSPLACFVLDLGPPVVLAPPIEVTGQQWGGVAQAVAPQPETNTIGSQ
jgi:hypothetical protein